MLELAREHGVLEQYAAEIKVGCCAVLCKQVRAHLCWQTHASRSTSLGPLPHSAAQPAPVPLPAQKPNNRTLADYERVGELKFGLLVRWRGTKHMEGCCCLSGMPGRPMHVAGAAIPPQARVRCPQAWRANLRRDLSLLAGGQERDAQALEAYLREAYCDALRCGCTQRGGGCTVQAREAQPPSLPLAPSSERSPCHRRLIQRCGSKSLAFWAAQRAGDAPTQASKQRVYQAAMQAGPPRQWEGCWEGAGPPMRPAACISG